MVVDPRKLSISELEAVTRAYVRAFYPHVGPKKDVPAPDVNTNAAVMAWMVDECVRVSGDTQACRATFTGKPLELGGSLGREQATGRGGFIVLDNLAAKKGWDPTQVTLAIQGIGNVGYWFGKLASQAGYKVVAVSDSKSAVLAQDWLTGGSLDLDALMTHKKKHGSLEAAPHVRPISGQQLLTLPVTVVVPAALENVINGELADQLEAEAVLELANGPVMPEADDILKAKGVMVVPDILANAGGVTVSYYEWLQNLEDETWSEKQVNTRLTKELTRAFKDVWVKRENLSQEFDEAVSLRQAAYVLAVSRVAEAETIKKT